MRHTSPVVAVCPCASVLMPGLCALLLPLAAASEAPLCTCDQASKDPLAKEYAYRSGICAGSPRQLGAGDETTVCQYAVHAEYNKNGRFNGAEPENFNASSVDRYPVFNGVTSASRPASSPSNGLAVSQTGVGTATLRTILGSAVMSAGMHTCGCQMVQTPRRHASSTSTAAPGAREARSQQAMRLSAL